MKPEKRNLIHDLLDARPDARREATLLAGGRILRRRRQWRVVKQSILAVSIVAVATLCLERIKTPYPIASDIASVPAVAPAAKHADELTDAELLALFPNTPVALATLDNGQKRLIFPRPGDQLRLITRL